MLTTKQAHQFHTRWIPVFFYLIPFLFGMAPMALAFDQQAPVMLELTPKEQAFVQDHPVIRVSNEMDWPPFDFAIGGQPFGLSIDLMNLLAQRLGLTLEYINGYSWSELMAHFKDGDIDILQSAHKTANRETFALFTRPYYRDKTVFIISRYAEPVSGIASFQGKTLAIPMGFAQETFISEHYPDIHILSVKNMEEAFQAITDGRADATVTLFAVARFMFEKNYVDSLKISGWFKEYDRGGSKSLHLMVQKGLPLLHGMLEKALASMPPGDLINLEKKWMGYRNINPDQKLSLAKEEIAFLQKNPVIRVANEMDWPPFDFVEDGKPAGFAMDYLALIGETIGIKFDIINGLSWPQLLEMGKQKEIDLFPCIWKTPDRESFFIFNPPYMKLVKVLVSKDSSLKQYHTLSELKGKKIALTKGYGLTELIMQEHPGPEYVIVNNNEDGLNQLSLGTVDGFVGTLGVINHIIKTHFIGDIEVIMEVTVSRDLPLHMAVRNDWPMMHKILNKAMKNITPEQFDALSSKWMGTLDDSTKIKNLSMAEKRYLEQKKELNICISKTQHPPYEYITQEGDYQGIVAEYYKQLSRKIGLPLKWHVQHDTPKSHGNDESQGYDIISMVRTGETAPADVQTTRPYVTYPLVIATDNNALFINTFEGLAQKTIGICSHTSFYPLIQKKYPAMNFIPVKTVEQGLAMVQKHSLFGFIDTAPKIGYYIQKQQILGIKISGEVPIKIEFKSGIKKDNAILSAILKKADHSLTREERHQLFQNWMQLNYHKGIDYDLLWKLGALVLFFGAFLSYRQRCMSQYNQKLAALNHELIQANSKLETMSYIDGLTQVPNRRRFDLVLTAEWQRCERNQHPLTLLMIDIDYFKRYNDCYGHLAGDDCLKKVAHTLNSASSRAADFTARYGGEEFAMVLPDTDKKGGKAVAQKILSDIEALKIPHETSLVGKHISVSIGVASLVPLPMLRPMQIVDFADQLLYQAKDQGRNRYVLSDDPAVA